MRIPDLEVEVMQRLREVEVEVNLYNVSKDVILSHSLKLPGDLQSKIGVRAQRQFGQNNLL